MWFYFKTKFIFELMVARKYYRKDFEVIFIRLKIVFLGKIW